MGEGGRKGGKYTTSAQKVGQAQTALEEKRAGREGGECDTEKDRKGGQSECRGGKRGM